MPIPVRCDCGWEAKARDEHAGRSVLCPKCGKKVMIPAAVLPSDDWPVRVEYGPTTNALERRVKALERRCRLLVAGGVLASLAIPIGVVCFMLDVMDRVEKGKALRDTLRPRLAAFDTIEAREFVVRSGDGKIRAVLKHDERDGPTLTLQGANGSRILLGILEGRNRGQGGGPWEYPLLRFEDVQRNTRVSLSALEDHSSFSLKGQDSAKPNILMQAGLFGNASLSIADDRMNRGASIEMVVPESNIPPELNVRDQSGEMIGEQSRRSPRTRPSGQ